MPRPKKEDRAALKGVTITLKLSLLERARLGRLVDARAAELFELTGQHVDVNISSYLRWLMDRDAAARGFAEAHPPTSSRRRSTPSRAKA